MSCINEYTYGMHTVYTGNARTVGLPVLHKHLTEGRHKITTVAKAVPIIVILFPRRMVFVAQRRFCLLQPTVACSVLQKWADAGIRQSEEASTDNLHISHC